MAIFSVGSLITAGLMPLGYSLIDEVLLILAVEILSRTSRTNTLIEVSKGRDRSLFKLHQIFFYILLVYFFFQSIRGAFIFEGSDLLDNIRKIRWVFYFLFLFLLSYLLTRRSNIIRDVQGLPASLAKAGVWYAGLYFATGIIYENIFGINRYDFQPGHSASFLWGTTAYALFPVVLAFPSSLICIKSTYQKERLLGYSSILLWGGVGIYYDSRVTSLVIAGFVLLGLAQLVLKKRIVPLMILAVVMTVSLLGVVPLIDRDSAFVGDMLKIWLTVSNPTEVANQANDLDRYLEVIAAYRTISSSAFTFLFGYGYRMSGAVIAPYLADVASEYSPIYFGKVLNKDWNNLAVEGMAAFLIDTGTVGAILLLLVSIVVVRRIWLTNHPDKLVLVGSVAFCTAWLFVIDVRDIVLYFLLVMPSGILCALAGCRKTTFPNQIVKISTKDYSKRLPNIY